MRETLAVTLPDDGDEENGGGESEEGSPEAAEGDDSGAPSRRSRWQRRRAAARARRDADRAAKLAEGNPDAGSTPDAPLDMAALLPGLPPRRAFPPAEATPLTVEEFVVTAMTADAIDAAYPALDSPAVPADRVAEIVAKDTAEDAALPDAVTLGLSDAALADMADDYSAAKAEAQADDE